MNKFVTHLLFFLLSVSIHSQQLNAVYIVSEGGFSAGSSTLSKLTIENKEFNQEIFKPGNIGVFADGLVHHNNNLYLTEQGNFGGPGKIYKLSLDGTVINSREIGTNPYSLAISNGKIFITNGPASSVSVISENDFRDVKTISVGAYPQEIISFNGKVFVGNNSLYGGTSDSTISVIDSDTDEVIETIHGRRDPNSFSAISLTISNDNHLIFACPGSGVNAIIYKVNLETYAKIDSFMIPGYGFDKDIWIDKNSSKSFFKSATNEIVQIDLYTREVSLVLSDQNILSINGYAYEYLSGHHYIADAKDFASNGTFTIYDSEGTLLNTYETSIAPRRIVMEYGENAVSVEDDFISSEFHLEQNYPNPFNPTTTIKYTILTPPQPSPYKGEGVIEGLSVFLKIYDILGLEVITLVNQYQKPGSYEVIFDGSKYVSGIYFYRLKAGNYTTEKKMMLLK